MKDGGVYEDILFDNLSVVAAHGRPDAPAWPLLISLDKRQETSQVGRIRNVTFSNLHLQSRGNCLFQAMRGQPIENLTLSNIVFQARGDLALSEHSPAGGRQEEHSLRECYHQTPAYFTLANVTGLTVQNVRIESGDLKELRDVHALAMINVRDATVDGLFNRASLATAELAEIRLDRCRDVMVTRCRPRAGVRSFLEVCGEESAGIVLGLNDLRTTGSGVELVGGALEESVSSK